MQMKMIMEFVLSLRRRVLVCYLRTAVLSLASAWTKKYRQLACHALNLNSPRNIVSYRPREGKGSARERTWCSLQTRSGFSSGYVLPGLQGITAKRSLDVA